MGVESEWSVRVAALMAATSIMEGAMPSAVDARRYASLVRAALACAEDPKYAKLKAAGCRALIVLFNDGTRIEGLGSRLVQDVGRTAAALEADEAPTVRVQAQKLKAHISAWKETARSQDVEGDA
jgi:hypothetical protein